MRRFDRISLRCLTDQMLLSKTLLWAGPRSRQRVLNWPAVELVRVPDFLVRAVATLRWPHPVNDRRYSDRFRARTKLFWVVRRKQVEVLRLRILFIHEFAALSFR